MLHKGKFMMNKEDELLISETKKLIIKTATECLSNHIPSSLSCLEILYTLYTRVANINLENAKDLIRDRVILSKEHARLGQVCLLTNLGLLPKDINKEWQQNGGRVGHDMFNGLGIDEISTIDVSSSSLGQGLGLGIGYAIAAPKNNIYVVVGDGELQEGSCWEAIMFISQHQIPNLTIIVDRNYLQISDYTKNVIDTSSTLKKRMESFDFDVLECDGHNIDELEKCFKTKTKKPKCVIANTIKGKEVDFLMQEKGCDYIHGWIYTQEEYNKILQEVK